MNGRLKMALTREFIRNLAKENAVELPKEFIDGIISEHTTSRDAYADEQVKTALENHKPDAPEIKVKETEEYKALMGEFETYKSDIAAKEAAAAKELAYRELLKSVGVSEKRIDSVVRVSDISKIEIGEDGKIKDADKLGENIKTEWADFIVSSAQKGADTANPPANNPAEKDPFLEGFDS